MRVKYFIMLAPTLLLAGSMTRSISDSDRTESRYYYGGPNPTGVQYQGEWSEFDVLGIDPGDSPSDEEVSRALDATKAGITTILVYLGVLESGTDNLATRTVSWVPIVSYTLPDKVQVASLKKQAYAAATDLVLARYVR